MGDYERQRICDEAPNFTGRQKFLLFDILHKAKCENVIRVTKSQNDSIVDLSKLPPGVIQQLYTELASDDAPRS